MGGVTIRGGKSSFKNGVGGMKMRIVQGTIEIKIYRSIDICAQILIQRFPEGVVTK